MPEESAQEIERLELNDKDVVVLLMKAGMTVEMEAFGKFMNMVQERLKRTEKNVSLLVMTDDIDLRVLDDEQLASIGLARIDRGN